MKKIVLGIGLLTASFFGELANAQIYITNDSIVGGEFSYTQNFTNITDGQTTASAIVLPTGWSATGSNLYRGTLTTSTTGGAYAYGSDTIGFLPSSSAVSLTYTLTIVNNSDFTFENFDLSYLAETWRATESRTNGWAVSYSINGAASISLSSLSYAVNGTTTVTPPAELSASAVPFSLTSGSTLTLSWVGDRGAGSGSSSGISIDDISFSASTTPVPEPSTYALLFGGAGVLFWVVRRKRQTA